MHIHIYTFIYAYKFIYTYTFIYTHSYVHIHSYVHAHSCIHICMYMYMLVITDLSSLDPLSAHSCPWVIIPCLPSTIQPHSVHLSP